MSATDRRARRGQPTAHVADRSPPGGTLTPAEIAWLVAPACAAVTVLLIVLLGPLVADVLLPRSTTRFFSWSLRTLRPEPREQGRFLVALAAPLLLAGTIVVLARRGLRLRRQLVRPLVWTVQAAVVAFAIVCLAEQDGLVFAFPDESPFTQRYFTDATLAVAVLGAGAAIAAIRSARVRATAARWAAETPVRRIAWTAGAALLIAIWLLHAFNTEHTVLGENEAALYHIRFTLDETYAVLNGHSPLVDFVSQYGSLWPYPVAGIMSLIGTGVGTFTALMCLVSGVALLAMYDVLRRVARSSLVGLLLFAPFLATSLFLLRGPLANRYTLATIFADYPLRFAGPWLLAWLTVRHLDGARPRAAWPLFLTAGLVVMNNTDHGVPALLGLLAALAWGARPRPAQLRRLALEAAGGLAGAYALVAILTLARAGALPDPALMVHFAKLFAIAGFAMLPMPVLGMHTIVYVTFAAALALATVRALAPERQEERVLTGALAFVAIFGLASGSYYAGRSHPEVLVTSFAAWSLALALMTLVVVRELAAQPRRVPSPAAATCLVAFCVAACSLAQTPTPWSQLERLGHTTPATLHDPAGQPFVAANVRPGEHVAILQMLGHRIAENVGVDDVTPYAGELAMPAYEQLARTLRALRAHGGTKVFLAPMRFEEAGLRPALAAAGYRQAAESHTGDQLWVDGAPRGGVAP